MLFYFHNWNDLSFLRCYPSSSIFRRLSRLFYFSAMEGLPLGGDGSGASSSKRPRLHLDINFPKAPEGTDAAWLEEFQRRMQDVERRCKEAPNFNFEEEFRRLDHLQEIWDQQKERTDEEYRRRVAERGQFVLELLEDLFRRRRGG